MDILRVLSRGIKPNPKSKAQAGAATTQLPSAGALPRPQLFHDPVSSRGKKRKRRRGAQDDEPEGDDEELSDVDYFAPKKAAPEAAPTDVEESPKKRKIKLLDEDECRQILRSHRLKFTILSDQPQTEATAEEEEPASKKKSSKKKKKEAEGKGEKDKKDKKDEHKKQIFPQPLTSFSELRHTYDVSPQLAANIAAQGFRVPTEVQMASLPLLLQPATALKKSGGAGIPNIDNGADFLAVAPTGSGKTITFLIPAIDGVLRRRAEEGRDTDQHVLEAVVVAPTRELATQIVNEGRKLAIGTGVRVVLMKRALKLDVEEVADEKSKDLEEGSGSEQGSDGEASEGEEESEGEEGKTCKEAKPLARVDILVTTPKILLNFLSGKAGARRLLPSVRSLILDEADVLLDPLFRKQTMAIWRACTHPNVALTCWSATMASNVEALVTKHLSKRAKKTDSPPRPLIRLALHDELKYDIPLEAGGSARVAVLHSSMADSARSKIMARFRAGEVWVLVTTDVLARGVDFAGVNGVVNYDVPTSAAAYVHRAGRTGRAGREGGVAVTFYTKDDIPFVKSVANVIAASEKQAGIKAGADGGGGGGTVQKWLLDALPKVAKEDKRKLKVRGVESRRAGGKATITTKSSWERRREHNRAQAVEASKRRKRQRREEGPAVGEAGGEGEWGGLED
ncbi:P-loop containing nucleoside triphosphate hydrolase protein [Chaetomium tenue]|uniref:P-loop containing nucleoside triphosphate hydrolase protein n=1 Tax=Chaetomium tenue TaxID=1854479 RepID=A0ACB7PPR0_9PEZI|nr:P-loop containing nucleoside triphosphate hydrolase protein [Chaetomium globosum]